MNRGHTADDYRRMVERLRSARPDLALSTDLIVGHPGESDEDFRATLDWSAKSASHRRSLSNILRAWYARGAATEQVPETVKSERLAALQLLLTEHQRDIQQAASVASCPCSLKSPAATRPAGRAQPLSAERPRRGGRGSDRRGCSGADPGAGANSLAGRSLGWWHELRCRPMPPVTRSKAALNWNLTTICCSRCFTASATSTSTASSGSSAFR